MGTLPIYRPSFVGLEDCPFTVANVKEDAHEKALMLRVFFRHAIRGPLRKVRAKKGIEFPHVVLKLDNALPMYIVQYEEILPTGQGRCIGSARC